VRGDGGAETGKSGIVNRAGRRASAQIIISDLVIDRIDGNIPLHRENLRNLK
jgi:hypothetical protein